MGQTVRFATARPVDSEGQLRALTAFQERDFTGIADQAELATALSDLRHAGWTFYRGRDELGAFEAFRMLTAEAQSALFVARGSLRRLVEGPVPVLKMARFYRDPGALGPDAAVLAELEQAGYEFFDADHQPRLACQVLGKFGAWVGRGGNPWLLVGRLLSTGDAPALLGDFERLQESFDLDIARVAWNLLVNALQGDEFDAGNLEALLALEGQGDRRRDVWRVTLEILARTQPAARAGCLAHEAAGERWELQEALQPEIMKLLRQPRMDFGKAALALVRAWRWLWRQSCVLRTRDWLSSGRP